jgi:hypothetical protein
VVLADGFSCRVQLDDLRNVTGLHLAQLLRDACRGADEPGPPGTRPVPAG